MKPTEPSVAQVHALSGVIDIDTTSLDMRSAQAFFLTNLGRIVGDAPVTAGDDEFDYFVRVRASRLHDVGLRISRLQFKVQERFGVVLTAMPIPFAD
jgi:hypothetical protein